MPQSIGDFLRRARRDQLVGRRNELALFTKAILSPALPFIVYHLYGPGGVGKSTLVNQFYDTCIVNGIPVYKVSARTIEVSTTGLLNGISEAIDEPNVSDPIQYLHQKSCRQVILIDTYELITGLDAWIRNTFIPKLPADTLIVLAGRDKPQRAWQDDLGWHALTTISPLRNLSRAESRQLLIDRNVNELHHDAIIEFTRGYPLGLVIVADAFDQNEDLDFQPDKDPDIIRTLLEQFVQKVPGPAHRAALECCAIVRVANESILAAMLPKLDVQELFAWLRKLSFVETSPDGLFLHDLACEVLVSDLKWRNPEWYKTLHKRIRNWYNEQLVTASPDKQHEILKNYVYLHRDNPIVKPFIKQLQAEWNDTEILLTDIYQSVDKVEISKIVSSFEGESEGENAAFWLGHSATQTTVFRDVSGDVKGFLTTIFLNELTGSDVDVDPFVKDVYDWLQKNARLRPAENALFFRFWMDAESYQQISSVQSLIFIQTVRAYLATPNLAYTFIPCTYPDFWTMIFAYADLSRIDVLDREVKGQPVGVFGHDWRAVPPAGWLDLLASREVGAVLDDSDQKETDTRLVVLSEDEFATAVREALKSYTRPEALKQNPLLNSKLLQKNLTKSDTPEESLCVLIEEAAGGMNANPKEAKYFKALYRTYFKPAPTQEMASEMLGVPFSTYRRHLKRGINKVIEQLWMDEIAS